MNFFDFYVAVVKEYFTYKYFFTTAFFTVFFIYFLHSILSFLFYFEDFNLLYWEFISPLFIYLSMIVVISFYSYRKILYNESFLSVLCIFLFKGFFIIILKLIWNFFKVILIQFNIIPVYEDSGLYPLFLLGFFWLWIYFFSSYLVWNKILKIQNKSFLSYSIHECGLILFNLLFAFFFSFFIIIFISFILSKMQLFFSFLLKKNIHIFIEDILSISFNVFFAHMLSLLFVYQCFKNKKILK